MPFAPIDGGELFHESEGSGPPLLLVPGLGGIGGFWRLQVAAWRDRFTVVTHDHRGCGRSAKTVGGYTVERMADDVLALMDHLRIERADFVGHSTGGAIGQLLAVRAPARIGRLVLSSTWTHCDAFFARVFEIRRLVLRELGPEAYTRLGSLFLYDPAWIAGHGAALGVLERAALDAFPPVEIVLQRIDAICAFDGRAGLAKIAAPTLAICAVDDAVTPIHFSRAIAAAVPGARLVELDGGGHFCPVTRAADYNRAVLDFLAG
jgi:aminoacrylate hydrolase